MIQHHREVISLLVGNGLLEDLRHPATDLVELDRIRFLAIGQVVNGQLEELLIGEVPLALEQQGVGTDIEVVLAGVEILGHTAIAPGVAQQVLHFTSAQGAGKARHLLVAAGGVTAGHVQITILALEEIAGILGGDGNYATQRIGAVGGRRRPLGHFYLLDHVGIKVALANTALAVSIVLSHTVAHHLDPVFPHAADDEGLGIPLPTQRLDSRLVAEQVGDVGDDLLFNLLGGDHRDGAGDIFQFLLHP